MLGLVTFSLMGGLFLGMLMHQESKARSGSMKGLILFISGVAVLTMFFFPSLEMNLGVLLAGTGHLLGSLEPEE
jgi:dolichol kinase